MRWSATFHWRHRGDWKAEVVSALCGVEDMPSLDAGSLSQIHKSEQQWPYEGENAIVNCRTSCEEHETAVVPPLVSPVVP